MIEGFFREIIRTSLFVSGSRLLRDSCHNFLDEGFVFVYEGFFFLFSCCFFFMRFSLSFDAMRHFLLCLVTIKGQRLIVLRIKGMGFHVLGGSPAANDKSAERFLTSFSV